MSETSNAEKLKKVILSAAVAVFVWLVVIYTNPPEIKTTVSNLPVRFTGERQLKEKGFLIVDKSQMHGLSVSVKGKRNDLLKFTDGIYVDVDVSTIDDAGEYELSGNVSLPTSKLTIESLKFNSVKVKVEEEISKDIKIKAEQSGHKDGKIFKIVLTDKIVTLTGAKSEIENVSHGIAKVDVSSVNQNEAIEVPYVLMDETNSLISKNETITASKTTVNAECTEYDSVLVPVELILSDELKEKWVIDTKNSSITPSSVEIGTTDGLSPTKLYALVESTDEQQQCNVVYEDGIYLPYNSKKVDVKLALKPFAQKKVKVKVKAENLKNGLSVNVDEIEINVSGAEDELVSENVSAYVDLKGFEKGEYNVPVRFKSDKLKVTGEYNIDITIS